VSSRAIRCRSSSWLVMREAGEHTVGLHRAATRSLRSYNTRP
jgi:hypothetical protein